MTVATLLKENEVAQVLVVDDAFGAPTPKLVSPESITLFSESLRDDANRVVLLGKLVALPDQFDPVRTDTLQVLIDNEAVLTSLWSVRTESDWTWLNDGLFKSFLETKGPMLGTLIPLQDYIDSLGIARHEFDSLDFENPDLLLYKIIFLDFYLEGENGPEKAYARASRLQEALLRQAEMGALESYPTIVLMSSRKEAERLSGEFKNRTGLRGDFFRFVDKDENIARNVQTALEDILPRRKTALGFVMVLDQYWLAARRSADIVRESLLKVEPSELALLHHAALAAEREPMCDYLSWLTAAYQYHLLLGDPKLREASAKFPATVESLRPPGAIPPTSRLSDMYLRASFQQELSDQLPESRQVAVSLGDVFAEEKDGKPAYEKFLIVLDQSCDLRHGSKERVIVVRASEVKAVNDLTTVLSANIPSASLLPLLINGERNVYQVNWQVTDPDVVLFAHLKSRTGFHRLGRLSRLPALALQEKMTQNVGRVGLPVSPPATVQYHAKLFLRAENGQETSIDALSKPWASVVVFDGRFDSRKSRSSKLSFTENFAGLIRETLGAAQITDTQLAGIRQTVVQHVSDHGYVDMEYKRHDKLVADGVDVWYANSPNSPQPKDVYTSFTEKGVSEILATGKRLVVLLHEFRDRITH
ncbi:hypothetical protein GIY62_10815 [Burkholderia plantarii]|uniref:hypothetical protein n=1 Tax=Burkholderia plantarii TaxID=41899 RepID=UPI00272B4DEC|nr:hypothetical protein [Burkholderia plantarii]WLE57657.1 hypothetical protein GIY62_10815 [Burkholderia plantarii]